MGNETLKGFLLVLLYTTSAFSLPSVEFDEHILRIIRSDDIDGYDIATVQAVDSATNEERGQTKRDIEAHASDPSSGKRSFSFLLTSGERLRMSLARRSIDTSGATFSKLTEEGEREITFRQPTDCFFGGKLEGEEGYASLAMCGGQMMGSVTTAKRTYEIHSLSGAVAEKTAADDVMHVLVTWQEGERRERETHDGIELPENAFMTVPDDANVTEVAVKRTMADRRLTIEIADFVDKHFIRSIGNLRGKTTDEQIINFILNKWSQVHQSLSDVDRVGWNITLRLVQLTLWRESPSWYRTSPSDTIYDRLKKICTGTKTGKYDQVTLHTSYTSDPRTIGLSWVGGLCMDRYRCSAVIFTNYSTNTELHELGHNIGLQHDAEMTGCAAEGEGFMSRSSNFLNCYRQRLIGAFHLSHKKCVFSDRNPETVQIFN